jgi:NAD-dependent dihydropyrimidine dehydrogenase PreA subunit
MENTGTKIKRKIVKIDEEKCDGCGICVTACAEGALKIVDGKARLISDKYCDSLGACLPGCPQDAISIVEREAEPFDEEAVKLNTTKHAAPEPACGCPSAAVRQFETKETLPCGCPSSTVTQFKQTASQKGGAHKDHQPSSLGHWPVQMTLVPPKAPFLQGADLLIAADCASVAYPDFHSRLLPGKTVRLYDAPSRAFATLNAGALETMLVRSEEHTSELQSPDR